MKNITFTYIVIIISVLSCAKQTDEDFYPSKMLGGYKLSLIDSLIYQSTDSSFISQTHDIMFYKNYILISDYNFAKVWILSLPNENGTRNKSDKDLKLVKSLGRKGHGPQEYTYPPNIIFANDTLFLVDSKFRSVNIYDSKFNFIKTAKLPKEIVFPGYAPIFNGNKFIFFGFKPEGFSYDELSDIPSLFAFDSNFHLTKGFFPWDKEYENKTAYLLDNLKVLLCNGDLNDFFAKQTGTFKIVRFNKDFNKVKVFGIKPQHFKYPPDLKFEDVQKSAESAVDFTSNTTKFLKIDYDKKNAHLFINYVNLEKNFFYERTLLLGNHYLQVYNRDYNCIYDGLIPGKLAFVNDSMIYILTDERPKFIKIKVYKLIKQ
ncbi:hypothetical protein ABRY23_05960 [Melioribacteraceae bacterium 4301-Me]|uniref:hypothetical protein n=1 Tax=Pyranulibacter aquaticus TaxID=3163344 RepID=UPI00359851E7